MSLRDDKERNYFSLRTMFWKCLFPILKCVWKVHHKNRTFQWQKIYKNIIHWIVASNALARFRIVTHCYASSFLRKIILYETNNIFYSLRNQKWDKTNDWSLEYIENNYQVTLSNILKTLNAKKFTKTILESTYKVVLGTYNFMVPTRPVSLLRAVEC